MCGSECMDAHTKKTMFSHDLSKEIKIEIGLIVTKPDLNATN